MNKIILLLISSFYLSFSFADDLDTYNDLYISSTLNIEVTLKNVEMAPRLNDHNMLFLGSNDFEMFLSLNGNRYIEFPLESNRSNNKKKIKLNKKIKININDLNDAISKRSETAGLTQDQKRILIKSKVGQLCLLDDSLFTPEMITTSWYGCFDLVSKVQEMISKKIYVEDIYVEKNTTFPVSNDPKKIKLFKSWYQIKISKQKSPQFKVGLL